MWFSQKSCPMFSRMAVSICSFLESLLQRLTASRPTLRAFWQELAKAVRRKTEARSIPESCRVLQEGSRA